MLVKMNKTNLDQVRYGKVSREKKALVQASPPTYWTKEESHLSEVSLKAVKKLTRTCFHRGVSNNY